MGKVMRFFSQSTCYTLLENCGIGGPKSYGYRFFGYVGVFLGQKRNHQAEIIGTISCFPGQNKLLL